MDHCADVIYFGAMAPCTKCSEGKFRFGNTEYLCDGYINPWVECDNVVKEPERRDVEIPSNIKNAHSFLAIKFFKHAPPNYNPAALVPKSFWAHPQADLSRYLTEMKPNGELFISILNN